MPRQHVLGLSPKWTCLERHFGPFLHAAFLENCRYFDQKKSLDLLPHLGVWGELSVHFGLSLWGLPLLTIGTGTTCRNFSPGTAHGKMCNAKAGGFSTPGRWIYIGSQWKHLHLFKGPNMTRRNVVSGASPTRHGESWETWLVVFFLVKTAALENHGQASGLRSCTECTHHGAEMWIIGHGRPQ